MYYTLHVFILLVIFSFAHIYVFRAWYSMRDNASSNPLRVLSIFHFPHTGNSLRVDPSVISCASTHTHTRTADLLPTPLCTIYISVFTWTPNENFRSRRTATRRVCEADQLGRKYQRVFAVTRARPYGISQKTVQQKHCIRKSYLQPQHRNIIQNLRDYSLNVDDLIKLTVIQIKRL